MARFEHHIFVCENVRPEGHPRGCCSLRGSPMLRELLKTGIEECGLKGSVRANSAGCLDQCAKGATLVIYPGGVWYGGVTPADVPEILDALVKGKIVERLVIPDAQLTGRVRG